MDNFSYIPSDEDTALVYYAKEYNPQGKCNWQDGGFDHILRYYNKLEKRVAIDIGASYGFFTVGFAQYFEQVHSFEINPRIFEHHKKNISYFNNITFHEFGLSNYEGEAVIKDYNSTGRVRIIEGGDKEATVKTLDSLNIENVDLIKIDVEGHECEVFMGAVETITKFRPVIMFEWWSLRDMENEIKRQWIFNFLHNLDYKFADHRHQDYLFIPQ